MSKKALFIGINYTNTPYQLNGCINDINNCSGFLSNKFGLNLNDSTKVKFITDLTSSKPTKANILSAFNWLLQGVKSGDTLFLHYSGHGTQVNDLNKDEIDKKDECIVPLDFTTSGFIVDDDIYTNLVTKVPKGVKLFAVLDCCNSGSGMDLKYNYVAIRNIDTVQIVGRTMNILGDVIMLSGCRDEQTSADTWEQNYKTKLWESQGALTWAFLEVINMNDRIPLFQFIKNIRTLLSLRKYTQIPQLSFSQFPNLKQNIKLL